MAAIAPRSDQPLRVLFLETSLGLGGSTISLYSLLRHLNPSRVRASVVVAREDQARYLRAHLGLEIEVVVAAPATGLGGRPAVARLGRSPHLAFRMIRRLAAAGDSLASTVPHVVRLYRFARRRRIQLIHQKNGFDVHGFLVSRLLGVPIVAYQEGDEYPSLLVRLLAPRVDRYMACSMHTASNLSRVGVPPERVRVVYPPIDPADFPSAATSAPTRADLGIPEDAPCIGILGVLQRWKGQDVFLRAVRAVIDVLPGTRACVIGAEPGEGRAYTRHLRELAVHLGIADRVVFTGFLPDVPRAIQLLDVVVHASVYPEPFGRVIAESMALGKPVVATDAGGAREIVRHGVTGLLVPPGDEAALAEAIMRLVREPGLARRLAEAGQIDALARFSATAHAELVEQIYGEVLGGLGGSAEAAAATPTTHPTRGIRP